MTILELNALQRIFWLVRGEENHTMNAIKKYSMRFWRVINSIYQKLSPGMLN